MTGETEPALARAAAALAAEGAAIRAVRHLRAAGLEPVVMKGTPLARRLYGSVDARGVPVDTDLLVARREVPAALDALVEAGYRPPPPAVVRARLAVSHELPLTPGPAAPGPTLVDLHWSPWSVRLYPPASLGVAEHLEPLELGGTTITVFDRALTIVHLGVQYSQGGFTEPRLLRDLVAAWSASATTAEAWGAFDLAERLGAHHALAYALGVAHRVGLLSCPAVGAPSGRARRLALVAPRGRRPSATPDYVGLLLALTLADPRRAWAGLAGALAPPKALLDASAGPRPLASAYAHRAAGLATGTLSVLRRNRAGPATG